MQFLISSTVGFTRQKGYTINQSYNENIFTVSDKETDPLEAIVRRGAKLMLQVALETEVTEYLERTRHQRTPDEEEFRGASLRLLSAEKADGRKRDDKGQSSARVGCTRQPRAVRISHRQTLSTTVRNFESCLPEAFYRRTGDTRFRAIAEMFDGRRCGAIAVDYFAIKSEIQTRV